MEVLENILSDFNTNIVNSIILIAMFIIFFLGLFFTKKAKQSEFVQYIPTLLTTIGIFGTFLGIVLGLLEFNQLDIEASIPPLLEGLKTAFITSLAGIFSSLIFKTLSTFSFLKPKQIKNIVEHASPEAILSAIRAQLEQTKILKEALVGNEESTLFGQLKLLRADINDHAKLSIKNQQEQSTNQQVLALKQQENFDGFSQQLWVKLQDFADTLSKSATEQVIEALKQVICDFNNNLTEQFGENFKQLNDAVLKLVDWQENYKLQLGEMTQQYAQGVEAISQTQVAVAHIGEQTKAIPESMNDLKGIMDVNQHQIAELERHLEGFALMRDEAVKAVPEIRSQVQNTVNDISEAVSVANDHYKVLLSESDLYIKAHVKTSHQLLEKFSDETQKGMNIVSERLIEGSELISKNIDIAAIEFANNTTKTNLVLQTSGENIQFQAQGIQDKLEETLSAVNRMVGEMVSSLTVDVKEITNTMKQANQNLVTDTEQVRELVVKSIEKLQQRLNEVIDDVATQQINQAKRTFDAMEDQVKQQVGLTAEAVDSQLKLIDSAMQQEINRVMNEMGQALAQVSGKFVEDYVKLTNAMNDIINQRVA